MGRLSNVTIPEDLNESLKDSLHHKSRKNSFISPKSDNDLKINQHESEMLPIKKTNLKMNVPISNYIGDEQDTKKNSSF